MYTVHVHIYIYDHICISRWSTIQESRFVKLPEGKDTYIVMPQLALLVNVTSLGAELMVDIIYMFFLMVYKRTQNRGQCHIVMPQNLKQPLWWISRERTTKPPDVIGIQRMDFV